MKDFNDVFVSGRLGQDSEIRYAQSGIAMTNFSMAVSENYKSGNNWNTITNWINVVLYGKEIKISKGEYVFVRGRIRINKTDKATYFQIIASFITTARDAAGLNKDSSKNTQQNQSSDSVGQAIDDAFDTVPVDQPDTSNNDSLENTSTDNLPEDDDDDSVPF